MNTSSQPMTRDFNTAMTSLFLAFVAVLALWQAREFSEFGAIFPLVIASALLICSIVVLVRSLIARPQKEQAAVVDHEFGGLKRSISLIAVMLLWVSALEYTGFILTSGLGFLALALIADAERPTVFRTATYAGVAFAVVIALQLIFQHALKVRLPSGDFIAKLMGW